MNPDIEKQARYLAKENRLADPTIEQVFWFPDDREVRLIETTSEVPGADEDQIRPFYFRANPKFDLPAPSGIALIRPDEIQRLKPPSHWGDWSRAQVIEAEDVLR